MKKLLLSNWPLVGIFFLSLFILWPVFVPGYFSHHDDLQVMRIFEMRKCFTDLQIPCRWVPDMGFGNGIPLFNFYAPFSYYLGALISYVLGYLGAAKSLFLLPLLFGGIGMYLLGRELFGKIPGFVAGVLYLFAPYRALDAFVRGAIGESFAIALIPFVFYFFYRKNFVWASIFTALFITSHNIMTMIFAPLIVLWVLLLQFNDNWKNLKSSLLCLLIGFGLSAFFIFPAYFEKGLVQTESLTRAELDFRSQFVRVPQLFVDRTWNYSSSAPLSDNTISYQIGWPHWWLVIVAAIVFIKSKKKNFLAITFLFSIFSIAVFMTHNKSAFVWEKIKLLAFVQFPWRFLSIVIFSASLLGAYFTSSLKGKWLKWISVLVVVVTILLNWRYFRPEHFYKDVTNQSKLSGQSLVDQQKGALLDYLPKTALEPRELSSGKPEITKGDGSIKDFVKKSNTWSFVINSKADSIVEVPVFDFPGWTIFVDGEKRQHSNNNILGRIAIPVQRGEHKIVGRFLNTPIRTISDFITLVSALSLAFLYAKNRKINRKV